MRIDKIIEKCVRFLFRSSDIKKFLQNKIPLRLRLWVFLIFFKKAVFLYKKGQFRGLKNIEGMEEYNISSSALNVSEKQMGISALARLKNGDEFLEVCIRGILPFVDEVILLVDMNSTDRTIEICEKFSKEFPKKCRIFHYFPEVFPGNHPKYSQTPDNSIHSLSYFYNFCLAQARYQYAFKMDDDMLVIPENFREMTDFVRRNHPNYFLILPQVNVSRYGKNDFAIATKYFHSGIAAAFGDHGIFPVSSKMYFFNDVGCENFVFSKFAKFGKISFLHLKNLKNDQGQKNYNGYSIEYLNELQKGSDYISLPDEYKLLLQGI